MRSAMAAARNEPRGRITNSSGNVFADLGFADAEQRQTKARLAVAINGVIARRRLSQVKAAPLLGINQPKVSALTKYRLAVSRWNASCDFSRRCTRISRSLSAISRARGGRGGSW